ncbi:MAG: hypothetical protein ACRDTG_29635 [Pseudonocardiaceae bacterium]
MGVPDWLKWGRRRPATPPQPFSVRGPEPLATGPSQRLKAAEARIDSEVERQPTLDAGTAELLDAQIDSWKADWLVDVGREHLGYLDDLTERLSRAEAQADKLREAHKKAAANVAARDLEYRAARKRLGAPVLPDPASSPATQTGGISPPMNYNEDPGLALGVPFTERFVWVFVIGAIGADLAAFYSVIARLFRNDPFLVAVGTIGFTAAAVGIAHAVGVALKRRKIRHPRHSNGLLRAGQVTWLGLGLVAFFARLYVEPAVATQPERPLLLAATFAALYLVSGVLAMAAAYNTYNPDAWAVRRAARELREATELESVAHAAMLDSGQIVRRFTEEQARAPERKTVEQGKAEADSYCAKNYARMTILARLDDPGAPLAFIQSAPRP